MGRVEEAMRRAEEIRAKREGHPVADDASDTAAHITAALSVEEVDWPRLRTIAPSVDPAHTVPSREAIGEAPGVGAAVFKASSSIFERIDVGLLRKTVVDNHIDPISREQYRRLAATLHAAQAESGLKVIMIASALASEGKTLTATNLALTFSESYRRNVLLIDGDLRKPSLHTVFNLRSTPGFSEGLLSSDDRRLPIHRVSSHLTVLTAGRATADPMAALVSERAHRLIGEGRETFDWVIIDTPPIGLLSDASLLASAADGAVLVVKAASTPHDLVQRAIHALGRERVLGVVLNRVTSPVGGVDSKYYGNYYTGRDAGSGGKG
jgi:capsular exopolysaccharide synthesis family protein